VSAHVAGRVGDIPPGTRRILELDGRGSVGVFNVDHNFYALRNICPHQGGPLCLGSVHGTSQVQLSEDRPPILEWIREGEILRCPWHRWEFDIRTGQSLFPSRMRVKTYGVRIEPPPPAEVFKVRIEDGLVIVEIP